MTPHLHPRSRLTTSLFGTTLLVSFAVVGMPHILPCPAPRVRFAEADGRERRDLPEADSNRESDVLYNQRISDLETARLRKTAHECPVPKPDGVIGRIFGFDEAALEKPISAGGKNPRVEVRERDPS